MKNAENYIYPEWQKQELKTFKSFYANNEKAYLGSTK